MASRLPALIAATTAVLLQLATPARAAHLLPVWAMLDGDTPVEGARVTVIVAGAPVAQETGATFQHTNENGVTGLEFGSLPEAFVVEVSGGRAHGLPLRGTLRTQVEVHRSGDVVFVNPVTTLIAALQRIDPGLAGDDATLLAKDLLGLPEWHDVTGDLELDDAWFGGDRFLAEAVRRGSVDRLIADIVGQPDASWLFRDADEPAEAEAVPTRQPADASIAAPMLIGGIVKDVALGLLTEAVSDAGQQLLGKIFGLFGLPDPFANDELKEIKEGIDRLDARLIEVKKDLSSNNFNTLVAFANDDVADVDTAFRRFKHLLLTTDAPDRTVYGADTIGFIGDRIVPVPGRLNQKLGGSVVLADNILVAASKLVRQRAGRFFTPDHSRQVLALYDYFADVQARAGILLVAYWESRTYGPDTIRSETRVITDAIERQATQYLKPALPDGVFVDTQSGLMWTRTLAERLDGPSFERARGARKSFAGFTDFVLPTFDQYAALVAGSPERNAAPWLQKNAGLSTGVGGLLWGTTSLQVEDVVPRGTCSRFGCPDRYFVHLRLFDLSSSSVYDHCPFGNRVRCPTRKSRDTASASEIDFVRRQSALALYLRTPTEKYWFE